MNDPRNPEFIIAISELGDATSITLNLTGSEGSRAVFTVSLPSSRKKTTASHIQVPHLTLLSLLIYLCLSMLAVVFRVRCSGRYTDDGSGGVGSLVITCETRAGSTESIASLRYSVNGGAEQTGL